MHRAHVTTCAVNILDRPVARVRITGRSVSASASSTYQSSECVWNLGQARFISPLRKIAPDKRTDEQKQLFKEYPGLNVDAGSLDLFDRDVHADDLLRPELLGP